MEVTVKHCRLCAKEKEDVLHLLSKEARKMSLTEKIVQIGIDISLSNALPKFICADCRCDLEKFVKFIDKVKEAQKLLFEILKLKAEDLEKTEVDVVIKEENEFIDTEEITLEPINPKYKCDYCDREFKFHVNMAIHMKDHEGEFFDIESKNSLDFGGETSLALLDLEVKQQEGFPNVNEISIAKDKLRSVDVAESDADIQNSDLEDVANDEFNFCKIDSKNGSWNDYTWFCSQCEMKCDSANSLRSHWINSHQTCCKFSCVDCISKKFIRYKTFLKHVYEHRPFLANFCFFCNLEFITKRQAKAHLEEDHNLKLTCHICAESFADHEIYDNHMTNIAKCANYLKRVGKYLDKEKSSKTCNVCGKVFKKSNSLKVHLLTHEPVRKRDYACQFCAKSFYNKGTLKGHEGLHLGVYYQCDMCDKRVQTRSILVRHLRLHTNSYTTYPCEKCGKIFKSKTDLNTHVKYIHDLDCRFECEYCKKKFRFGNGYKIHLRQHTGEKPYSCDACSHFFTNYSNYSKHMKRKHGICIKRPVLPLKEEYLKILKTK